jgi:P27 family predicted phage terminase small subunit
MGQRGPMTLPGSGGGVRRGAKPGPKGRTPGATVEAARRPKRPTGLGKDGSKAWERVWTECGAWLASTDVELVIRYCRLTDERAQLEKIIAEDGYLSEGSTGQQVTSPVVVMRRAVDQQLRRDEATLGIGPANRLRMGVLVREAEQGATKPAPRGKRGPAPEGWHWNKDGTAIEEDK